jgi:hypothetical protein
LGGAAAVDGPLEVKIVNRTEVCNAEPARAVASDE